MSLLWVSGDTTGQCVWSSCVNVLGECMDCIERLEGLARGEDISVGGSVVLKQVNYVAIRGEFDQKVIDLLMLAVR